jgi:hypothetical protein
MPAHTLAGESGPFEPFDGALSSSAPASSSWLSVSGLGCGVQRVGYRLRGEGFQGQGVGFTKNMKPETRDPKQETGNRNEPFRGFRPGCPTQGPSWGYFKS